MARLSLSQHPVARVRHILGLQQKELAALIKASARTVQDIELGKLPLSRSVAIRMMIVTGVRLESLLHPERPLIDVGGRPYAADSKQLYGQGKLTSGATAAIIHRLHLSLGLIVEAANEAEQSLLVATEIEMALRDIIEKFGLEKHYHCTMRGKHKAYADPKAWRQNVADFQAGTLSFFDGGEKLSRLIFAEALGSKRHFKSMQERVAWWLLSSTASGRNLEKPKQQPRQQAVTPAARKRKK
jgi:hypothetical protein